MLGEIISGVGSLLNFFGGQKQQKFANQMAQQQFALQQQLATQGVQMKVKDSLAAGIHPLVGLGAQTASFSPVSVGGGDTAPKLDGQDIGRALKAAMGEEDREKADEAQLRRLQIERASLENDALRTATVSKLRREASQVGPPLPVGSQIPLPRPGPLRSASGEAIGEEEMKSRTDSAPGVRNMKLWGVYPVEMDPTVASGQDLENEFGEFGGSAMAIPNIPAHLVHDWRKNKWPAIQRRIMEGGPPPKLRFGGRRVR